MVFVSSCVRSTKRYFLDQRAQHRLDFINDSQQELNTLRRKMVDDYDSDSDDHMESSRTVIMSPSVTPRKQKTFSILSTLNKCFKMLTSFILPRKFFSKVCSYFNLILRNVDKKIYFVTMINFYCSQQRSIASMLPRIPFCPERDILSSLSSLNF